MTCDKQHVTSAGFMGLVREREELIQEVEILRAQLVMARDGALEEAAQAVEAETSIDEAYYFAKVIRAMKGAR